MLCQGVWIIIDVSVKVKALNAKRTEGKAGQTKAPLHHFLSQSEMKRRLNLAGLTINRWWNGVVGKVGVWKQTSIKRSSTLDVTK